MKEEEKSIKTWDLTSNLGRKVKIPRNKTKPNHFHNAWKKKIIWIIKYENLQREIYSLDLEEHKFGSLKTQQRFKAQ